MADFQNPDVSGSGQAMHGKSGKMEIWEIRGVVRWVSRRFVQKFKEILTERACKRGSVIVQHGQDRTWLEYLQDMAPCVDVHACVYSCLVRAVDHCARSFSFFFNLEFIMFDG